MRKYKIIIDCANESKDNCEDNTNFFEDEVRFQFLLDSNFNAHTNYFYKIFDRFC